MWCDSIFPSPHWQSHRLTLLCILDCAAHLLPVPEEVENSFLNQTIKVFTKVGIHTQFMLNRVSVCLVGFKMFPLLSRLTLPQRRTSLCTLHWKQSWLPFFMSWETKLWRRMNISDRPQHDQSDKRKSYKQGSTLICGHYCILSQFLAADTAEVCQTVVFEAF